MKHLDIKNKNSRDLVKQSYKRQFVFNSILKNNTLSKHIRIRSYELGIKKKLRTKINSQVFITNRCIFSYRKNRLNKKILNASRLVTLQMARRGEFYGIRKAVW